VALPRARPRRQRSREAARNRSRAVLGAD
jgi:hypothetical protein